MLQYMGLQSQWVSPLPGDLPNPGIEPVSLMSPELAGRFFLSSATWDQGKPVNITVIQVYASTSNTEEAEVERFYEDLQDLLELTPKKMSFSL